MFFDDDLPVWGFIGKTEGKPAADGKAHVHQYLFTHFHFDIGYNGNQVGLGWAGLGWAQPAQAAAGVPPCSCQSACW